MATLTFFVDTMCLQSALGTCLQAETLRLGPNLQLLILDKCVDSTRGIK
jgi:hypothetical protein